MDDMRTDVTNVQVGKDLGVTHVTISRIRSGDRLPSLDLMVKIESLTRWKISAQTRERQGGTYAAAFERALHRHYHPEQAMLEAQRARRAV